MQERRVRIASVPPTKIHGVFVPFFLRPSFAMHDMCLAWWTVDVRWTWSTRSCSLAGVLPLRYVGMGDGVWVCLGVGVGVGVTSLVYDPLGKRSRTTWDAASFRNRGGSVPLGREIACPSRPSRPSRRASLFPCVPLRRTGAPAPSSTPPPLLSSLGRERERERDPECLSPVGWTSDPHPHPERERERERETVWARDTDVAPLAPWPCALATPSNPSDANETVGDVHEEGEGRYPRWKERKETRWKKRKEKREMETERKTVG